LKTVVSGRENNERYSYGGLKRGPCCCSKHERI